jgi:hypothetical protein
MENQEQNFDFEFDSSGKPRRYLTRSQWRSKGRMVDARDQDAVKIITTNAGHQLRLYSFEQTIER